MAQRGLGDIFRQAQAEYADQARRKEQAAQQRAKSAHAKMLGARVSEALHERQQIIATALQAAIAAAKKGDKITPLCISPVSMGFKDTLTLHEVAQLPACKKLMQWCRRQNIFIKMELRHTPGGFETGTGDSSIYLTVDFTKPYQYPQPVRPVPKNGPLPSY